MTTAGGSTVAVAAGAAALLGAVRGPRLAAPSMPEGHTIHRAARDHARDLARQTLRVTSPQGRFDVGPQLARGKKLVRVEAYGKHLFYVFERGTTIHVHLGLFGKFYRKTTPAPAPRPTTRMRLEGEAITIDLVGPTACEVVGPKKKKPRSSRASAPTRCARTRPPSRSTSGSLAQRRP